MKRLRQGIILLVILGLFIGPNLLINSMAHASGGITLVVKDNKGNDLINESNLSNGPHPQTALEILKNQGNKANIRVEVKNSSYGQFINSMSKGSNKYTQSNNDYWAFFLNGVQSFGYPNYKPKAGDQLEFEFIPSSGVAADEVSVGVNSKYGTLVKLVKGATVLSALQKLEGTDQVVVQHNTITTIAGKSADASHSWQITLNRNGQDQTITDLSTPVQGKDQIFFNLVNQSALTKVSKVTSYQLTKAIDKAASYVNKKGVSDWSAIALSKANKSLPSSYLTSLTKTIKSKKGKFSSITDTERTVLGILAAGGDPTTISGYNLMKSIYNGDVTEQNKALNGVIYGLIALDSANFKVPNDAKWTKSKMVDYILKHQNSDGGWAWDGSSKSDLDTTGMALISLAKHTSSSEVQTAVKKAEAYLSSSVKQGKVDNSATAAQLIIGLTSNGVDPEGADFTTKDGKSLLSYLLTFQQADGGFNWQSKDESVLNTEQGIQALVSEQLYREKKGALYTFTLSKKMTDQAVTTKKTTHGKANYFAYYLLGVVILIVLAAISYYFYKKRRK